MTDHPLRVLFIAAEADPLAKVGGLGDVAGSLPLAVKHSQPEIDIRLAIPFYSSIHQSGIEVKPIGSSQICYKDQFLEIQFFVTEKYDIPIYLIDGLPVSQSKAIYGTNFEQDAEKFIFFSLSSLKLSQVLHWEIDILQANDWHTAISLHAIRKMPEAFPEFSHVKTILTLHNLPFMGTGSEKALENFSIPPCRNPRMPSWSKRLPLPMGINSADKIVAVSPTYAQEIFTPEYGCDLQKFLATKRSKIMGILNGIDYQVWNPQNDACLKHNYSRTSLNERSENKRTLQKEFAFPEDLSIPLLTFIGRMDRQKGIDTILASIRKLKTRNWQLIILGTGDKTLEKEVSALQKEYPKQIRVVLRFDSALSHRLYAGADILLMPSRYEPCGLAQLIAMRYGCIPVAMATGGLVDTICDFTINTAAGTGFLCAEQDSFRYAYVIQKAFRVFQNQNDWRKIQENAMLQDFSWQISAGKYIALYHSLLSFS
jgi:starch synthase